MKNLFTLLRFFFYGFISIYSQSPTSHFQMNVRSKSDGLILWFGKTRSSGGDFIAVGLKNGTLSVRYVMVHKNFNSNLNRCFLFSDGLFGRRRFLDQKAPRSQYFPYVMCQLNGQFQ